jgi:hypothetical protein
LSNANAGSWHDKAFFSILLLDNTMKYIAGVPPAKLLSGMVSEMGKVIMYIKKSMPSRWYVDQQALPS